MIRSFGPLHATVSLFLFNADAPLSSLLPLSLLDALTVLAGSALSLFLFENDSPILQASGAGLRQIVLLPPCIMMHQKHPAFDPDGVVVSEGCPEGGIDVEGRPCRKRSVFVVLCPHMFSRS